MINRTLTHSQFTNQSNYTPKYCPDCGKKTLELIERTKPDDSGEYKEICTCRTCENLIYLINLPE